MGIDFAGGVYQKIRVKTEMEVRRLGFTGVYIYLGFASLHIYVYIYTCFFTHCIRIHTNVSLL